MSMNNKSLGLHDLEVTYDYLAIPAKNIKLESNGQITQLIDWSVVIFSWPTSGGQL